MSGRLTTPVGILSFPALYEPKAAQDGGTPKYGACLVFEPGTDLSALEAAAHAAAHAKWGEKYKTMKLRWPIRKDDDHKYGDGEHHFINARSVSPPGIVDGQLKPIGVARANEMYPGAKVRATINAFCYDQPMNKGVTFGLNNLQKVADGQRIDGRRAAEADFEALPVADLEAAAADLI